MNKIEKTPVILTFIFLSVFLLYKSFSLYENNLMTTISLFLNFIPDLLTDYYGYFKDLIVLYLFGNILLFLIGKNMYKWNIDSRANEYIKMRFNVVKVFRVWLIPISIFLISFKLISPDSEYQKSINDALLVILIFMFLLETYWLFFKYNFARLAIKECGSSIDYFKRIGKKDKKYYIKSWWSTPFNDSGKYYYDFDFDDVNLKWDQINIKSTFNK